MNAHHKKPEKTGIWGRHPWAVACPDGRGRFVSWPFRRFVKAIAAVGGPSPGRVLRRRRRGLGTCFRIPTKKTPRPTWPCWSLFAQPTTLLSLDPWSLNLGLENQLTKKPTNQFSP